MALLKFDATTVAPSKGFEPIPAGWYDAKITTSEVKPTKDGTGLRLNLTYEIIGGEYNGRKIFDGLNIKNTSAKAQQIAQEQLSAICHAINVLNLTQTEQLHGHPMKLKVKIGKASEGYEPRNEISAWENINHKANGAVPPSSGLGAAARPAGFGGRPTGAPAPAAARPTGGPAAGARPTPAAAPGGAARPTNAAPPRPQPTNVAPVLEEQPWEEDAQAVPVPNGGNYVEGAAEAQEDGEDAPWNN